MLNFDNFNFVCKQECSIKHLKDEDIVSAGGALELVHQGVPFIAPLLDNYEAIAGSVWTLSSLREAAATRLFHQMERLCQWMLLITSLLLL